MASVTMIAAACLAAVQVAGAATANANSPNVMFILAGECRGLAALRPQATR